MRLTDKFLGVLLGGAIGDALGAPTEKREPAEILARFGEVQGFVPPWDEQRRNGRHKGDGHITDDTLMTQMLCRVYLSKRADLDAYDAATYLVPLLVDEETWVPEFGRTMPLVERLFYPEKYLYLRLHLANCDPREGGIGNMVNCGAAMYIAPIGLINAGNPEGAYREAIDFSAAHQWSYGREAAGVLAACVAAALLPGATVEDVLAVALQVARDGTGEAIRVTLNTVSGLSDWHEAIIPLQQALAPFILGGRTSERRPAGIPGRAGSIEELPAALGLLAVSRGDYRQAVLAAANYGRDSDSIASMAGSIAGGLCGAAALPDDWAEVVGTRNRIDFPALATDMASLFVELERQAWARVAERRARFEPLFESVIEC